MANYSVSAVAWPSDVALHDFCAKAQATLGGGGISVSATYNSGDQSLLVEITGASPTQQQVETAVRNWVAKTSQQVVDAAVAANLSRVLGQLQTIRNGIDGASNVTGLKVALTDLCGLVEKIVRYVVAQEKV